MDRKTPTIVAVALNPAFDRTLEVPSLEIGSHVRGRLLSVHPAGKAVNVARLLGALGTQCILTGFVGEGDRDRFLRSFEKSPVRVEMFEAHGITRENVTLVDPERGAETHVRDVGFPLSAEDLERLKKKLGILAAGGAYVIFAGSLTPGMEAEDFAGLLAVCIEKDARVAVDSSGPGLEAVLRAGRLWLVKPNLEELSGLAGRPVAGDDEAIRATVGSILGHVDQTVVTRGPDGAMLVSREGAWRARAEVDTEAVVNTVGSGDALLAGFVHCHAAGKGPAECLRFGVACGTASTLQLRAGLVNPYDVKACLEKVELVTMK
ncbi:MAG TPA: hexose kinase [Phycisphaerae bacterium]|nr:hexose kinase [Phycisphaerae bacterium]